MIDAPEPRVRHLKRSRFPLLEYLLIQEAHQRLSLRYGAMDFEAREHHRGGT
jgi:hypothetical protein